MTDIQVAGTPEMAIPEGNSVIIAPSARDGGQFGIRRSQGEQHEDFSRDF
jgi:hypothetical protein